ncbi:MAG: cyclic nucleotide-binding domain-containing protein [Candidatus Latescibacteria bacterium]|nr:cyclic nucleotide-binding domain-containing protein [Candidatus Latescibacterota bacterium]NIO56826.1 cyclic nucleotide-binding domain-containing protein [Candidatus Latescibacterota bacterium]
MVDTDMLRTFEIFEDLNDRELEQVAALGVEETRDAGVRIFEENALASHLYLILEGKVDIRISAGAEEQIVVSRAGPGEAFGWSAVAEPHTFTAATWTSAPSHFVKFTSDDLRRLFEANNHIGYRVLKKITTVISKRLKSLEAELVRAKHAGR